MQGTRRLAITTGLAMLGCLSVGPAPRAQQVDRAALLGEFVWRSIGPVNMGGRVDDIEAVESNPAIVYVGAATSGVWKSENGGVTWVPIFDGQPNLSIGDIAIAPSNPNIVWVGTGEANSRQSASYGGGLFKSVDAGRTWTFVGLPDSGHIGRILIDPLNPDVVYVAAAGDVFKAHPERGLYKTTDGGRTWTNTKRIDDDTGFIDVVMDPSNSQVLIAASYQRRRTAWGFNGGGPGSALWKTTDGAKTWRKVEGGGLPPYGQWGRTGLAISRSRPNIVYATIEPGPPGPPGRRRPDDPLDAKQPGIWRSEDKGATWRLVSNENGRPMYFSQIRVDPKDPNTIYSLQRSLFKSTDGGRTMTSLVETLLGRLEEPRGGTEVSVFERDPAGELPPSHPDHHAMWIDPNNPRHIWLGHDGGVDVSYDAGRSWELKAGMPMGQFYEIAVDMRQPYFVYGGLQDNGVWAGPSRVRNRAGISKEHWSELAAGDGYHVRVDPDDGTLYMSVSGGGGQHTWRYDLRTGERKYIRPTLPRKPDDRRGLVALPPEGNIRTSLPADQPLRFNWNPPVAMSPHNPRVLFFGANRLFISFDRGDSWVATQDLTKALDRDALSIMGVKGSEPIASKNDGVAQYGTIAAVAESPAMPGVLWVGTDDGNLQVSRDGGSTWTNVADRVQRFPTNYYVEYVEPSHFDAGTAYVAFDGHHAGDFRPHIFKTTDFGQTWTSISSTLPSRGHVNVVKEDRVNRRLLFAGTELGFYVSLDGGQQWMPLMNNLPATPVDDVLVHPRDGDLVIGTHGRSIYVLDDITPLRQLSDEVLARDAHLFTPRTTIRWDEDRLAFHGGGDEAYRAKNPPDAIFTYSLAAPAAGDVKLQVVDAMGTLVRELDAPRGAGVHRVPWDLRRPAPPPVAEPPSPFGPPPPPKGDRVGPGDYVVRLVVNGRTLTAPLRVEADPNRR